jgi:hypothetical protein
MGTVVNIALENGQQGELLVVLPDSEFYQKPVDVGQTVHLALQLQDVHPLAA